jgi:DnaJ homolog subfamily C member 9
MPPTKFALYTLLGVPKDADAATIARAYRRLALQHHPDRNPSGGETFKELTRAYEVLGDADRRAVYDATGIVPGDDAAESGDGAGRTRQRSAELGAEIAAFYATYRDSAEEAADLAAAYDETRGNLESILFETAVFQNEPGEVERIHGVLSTLISDGVLAATKRWAASTTAKQLKRYSRELAEEATEAKADLAELTGGAGDGSMQSLQLMLAQRNKSQASAWEAMTNNIAAKHSGKAGKKKSSK